MSSGDVDIFTSLCRSSLNPNVFSSPPSTPWFQKNKPMLPTGYSNMVPLKIIHPSQLVVSNNPVPPPLPQPKVYQKRDFSYQPHNNNEMSGALIDDSIEREEDEYKLTIQKEIEIARKRKKEIELNSTMEQFKQNMKAMIDNIQTVDEESPDEAINELCHEMMTNIMNSIDNEMDREYTPEEINDLLHRVGMKPEITLDNTQCEAVKFILFNEQVACGSIMGLEMGLGKTLAAYAAERISHLNDPGVTLVVAPTSVRKNWISEAKKFFGDNISIILFLGDPNFVKRHATAKKQKTLSGGTIASTKTSNKVTWVSYVNGKTREHTREITAKDISKVNIVITHFKALTEVWRRLVKIPLLGALSELTADYLAGCGYKDDGRGSAQKYILQSKFPLLDWSGFAGTRSNSKWVTGVKLRKQGGSIPMVGPVIGYEYKRIIIDEAHAMRNPDTLLAQMCHSFVSKYKLAMTGTPTFNITRDLWSLLRFIEVPQLFTYKQFCTYADHLVSMLKLQQQNSTSLENADTNLNLGVNKKRKPDYYENVDDDIIEIMDDEEYEEEEDEEEKAINDKDASLGLKSITETITNILELRNKVLADPENRNPYSGKSNIFGIQNKFKFQGSLKIIRWVGRWMHRQTKNDIAKLKFSTSKLLEEKNRYSKEGWEIIHYGLDDIAPAYRKVINIDSPALLQKVHNDIKANMKRKYKALEENSLKSSCIIETVTYLRMLCANPNEISDKIYEQCCDKRDAEELREYGSYDKDAIVLDYYENEMLPKRDKGAIFTHYIYTAYAIAVKLEECGIGCVVITGSMNIDERDRELHKFRTDPNKIFLVSTHCISEGITIIEANHVFFYDPFWHMSNDSQALSRYHRKGQKKDVKIIYLILKDTIEEGIIERAFTKELTNKTVSNKEQLKILGFEK